MERIFFSFRGHAGAHHEIAFAQADAPHAHGITAHGAHIRFPKTHSLSVMGGNNDVFRSVRSWTAIRASPFFHAQGADPVAAQIFQRDHRQAFYGAGAGDHKQEPVFAVFNVPGMDHGLDALALFHLQNVHNIGTLGGFAALWNLIALFPVYFAGIGKEENMGVGRGGEDVGNIVLFPGGNAFLPIPPLLWAAYSLTGVRLI